MNLRPPPNVADLQQLQRWAEDLYEFLKYPVFGGPVNVKGDLDLAAKSITGTSVDINNAELQQLSNIGATTISATQWGYLGSMTKTAVTWNDLVKVT